MTELKAKTRIFAVAMITALMAASVPIDVGALESKWTIESILSPKDIEVDFENPVLKQLDSASVLRQLGEMEFSDGNARASASLFSSSLGSYGRFLKSDDARVQSVRQARSVAQLKNGESAAGLKNLKVVLLQQINSDLQKELKIRKKMSRREMQEDGVESDISLEQRYDGLFKEVSLNPASSALYRARFLFWDNRLLDALRLTRISQALMPGFENGTAAGAKSRPWAARRCEIYFLQCLISYGSGKSSQFRLSKRLLEEESRVLEGGVSQDWQNRLLLVDALAAGMDGNYSECRIGLEKAELSLKSRTQVYDSLLVRMYRGNTQLVLADHRNAYETLNGVFEQSRRLVEGRPEGLIFDRMAQTCLDEMYRCLLLRTTFLFPSHDRTGTEPVDLAIPCLVPVRAREIPYHEDYEALQEALYHVGYQYKTAGRQERAQRMFSLSAAVCESYLPANRSKLASVLYDLAESFFWDELYDASISNFLRCAQIRKEIDPFSNEYIMTLNTLGRVYLAKGDAVEAIDCIHSALHRLVCREKILGDRIAKILSGLKSGSGTIFADDRDQKFLRQLCLKSLPEQIDTVEAERQRSNPDTLPQIDDLWQVLADAYSRNKSYDEAVEVSRRLLELRRKSESASSEEVLASLWQLAYICGVSNRLQESARYYTDMIDKHKDSAGRHLGHWYYARGVVVDSLGHRREACADFKKAISEYEKQLQVLDKIDAKERIEQIGWMISDLKEELIAKARCPADRSDYADGYEMCHWGADRFPLKVYIDDSEERGFGPRLYRYMRKAVDEWASTPGMEGRFVFVDDREKADIYFERVSNYDLIPFGSAGGASASFVSRGKRTTKEIDRVHLRLYCRDHDLDRLSNHAIEQLYTLALHEFGHGLGLGHSPNGLDVMYWKSAVNKLSSRDRSTLRKIYGCKDVSVGN